MPSSLVSILALTPITTPGGSFDVDEILTVDADTAAWLIASGNARIADAVPAKPTKKGSS